MVGWLAGFKILLKLQARLIIGAAGDLLNEERELLLPATKSEYFQRLNNVVRN